MFLWASMLMAVVLTTGEIFLSSFLNCQVNFFLSFFLASNNFSSFLILSKNIIFAKKVRAAAK